MPRIGNTRMIGWRRRAGRNIERKFGTSGKTEIFEPDQSRHCLCPECGYKKTFTAGQPCNMQCCPKCGTQMTRV